MESSLSAIQSPDSSNGRSGLGVNTNLAVPKTSEWEFGKGSTPEEMGSIPFASSVEVCFLYFLLGCECVK